MKWFSPKTPTEKVYLSVILPQSAIAQGETIDGSDPGTVVSIELMTGDKSYDPNQMLPEGPTVNTQPLTVNTITFPIGTVLQQRVVGGALNSRYRLRYKLQLTGVGGMGELLEEDCGLMVVDSVPL